MLRALRLSIAAIVLLGVLSAQTANVPFKVGDIAMAYSMFGWIQVRILEVRGGEYRINIDSSDVWVKGSNLRRPTAAQTRSGVGRLPPGGGAKQVPAPAPVAAPNPGIDTPAPPSLPAPALGKYDIVGIKVGMTVKDALLALKAHSPSFRLQPDSIRYDFLPYALTYGINALPLNLDPRDTRRIPPNAEQFYFSLTMAPNTEAVSKVARVMTFSKDSAPLGQTVASDLVAKYGAPTYDSGFPSLSNGMWEMYWVDDARGNRLRGWTSVQCNTIQTFKITHQDIPLTVYQTSELAMNPTVAKYRIENGYFNQTEFQSEDCASYTMVRARLYDARPIGVAAPNLLAGMMVMITSGPLDHSATDATHEYLQKAAKARDAKQTDAAKQNRPKL